MTFSESLPDRRSAVMRDHGQFFLVFVVPNYNRIYEYVTPSKRFSLPEQIKKYAPPTSVGGALSQGGGDHDKTGRSRRQTEYSARYSSSCIIGIMHFFVKEILPNFRQIASSRASFRHGWDGAPGASTPCGPTGQAAYRRRVAKKFIHADIHASREMYLYAFLPHIYRFSAIFTGYVSIPAVSRTVHASPGGQGRLRPMRRIYTQQFISSSPSPMYTGTENRQSLHPLLPTDVPLLFTFLPPVARSAPPARSASCAKWG